MLLDLNGVCRSSYLQGATARQSARAPVLRHATAVAVPVRTRSPAPAECLPIAGMGQLPSLVDMLTTSLAARRPNGSVRARHRGRWAGKSTTRLNGAYAWLICRSLIPLPTHSIPALVTPSVSPASYRVSQSLRPCPRSRTTNRKGCYQKDNLRRHQALRLQSFCICRRPRSIHQGTQGPRLHSWWSTDRGAEGRDSCSF